MLKGNYFMLADGKSAHTIKWAKELVKYYDVYVVSLNGFSDELRNLLGAARAIEYNVAVNVSGGNVGALKSVGFVRNLIKELKPAVVNAHYITSYGTVACLAAMLSGYGGKVVLSTWGTDVLVTPFKNKLYYYLTKFILKRATWVTSDSDYMTDIIWKIEPKAKVMTFPFGIEVMPEMTEDDKDDRLFFSNRALEENYNIDKVINLFYDFYQKDNSCQLVIAHDGTQREGLTGMVDSLGLSDNVRFVGYLTAQQMDDYYKRSRYYISIPTSDSTSVSLLEAMAHGCVPIVSDLPANREWIEDGVNGILYKGGSVDLTSVDQQMVFDKNRDMIARRAIWQDIIAEYIKELER